MESVNNYVPLDIKNIKSNYSIMSVKLIFKNYKLNNEIRFIILHLHRYKQFIYRKFP